MVSCDVTGGIIRGTKLKMSILTLYLPHKLQNRLWHFKSLYSKDKVSNKAYQNFRDKRLVRPGSKYLADQKYSITYQNIGEKFKVRPIFIPWNAQNGKKSCLTTYMDELSTKLRSLFLKPRKFTNDLPQFLSRKSGQTQK